MTATSSIFPIYVRSEYREGQGFKRFQSDAQRAANAAKAEFRGVANALDNALARDRTGSGSLNLGVGELREAALAQQQRAVAARELANATLSAATADGKFNAAMRVGVQAASKYAKEQERLSGEMLEQVRINELIQKELGQTASATEMVAKATARGASASRAAANDNRASRTAFIQLGQQMQDVTVQAQLGTNAFTIFSQQVPQAAFALSGLAGSANRTQARIGNLATFLAGPWGAAIFAATAVLGPYVARLFEADEALEQAEFSSSSFGDAQSILGGVIDLTTGKINTQSEALLNLARAQTIAGGIEAQARLAEAREQLADIAKGEIDIFQTPSSLFNRGELARDRDGTSSVAERFLAGDIKADQAITELEALEGTALATENALLKALGAVANVGVEEANIEVFERLREALDGNQDAVAEFLRPSRTKSSTKSDSEREAAKRKKDFEQSLQEAEQFAQRLREQETLLGKSSAEAQAYRIELAALKAEQAALAAPTEENAEALRKQADAIREAGAALAEGELAQSISDLREEANRRFEIERLILAGRNDEVAVLQTISRLRERQKELSQEQLSEVQRIVLLEQERQRWLERQQSTQGAFLDATRSLRGELESLLSGEGFDLEEIGKRLRVKLQVEQLFGEALRGIEGAVKASFDTSVNKATTGFDQVGDAAIGLANDISVARGVISGVPAAGGALTAGAANDNSALAPRLRDAIEESNSVTGMTPEAYAELVGRRFTEPLLAGLPPALAAELNGVFGRAFGGFFLGGPVAGGLGLLKGLSFEFGPDILGKQLNDKILKRLDGAFSGALDGTQTDAILDLLGIKSSATGAAIGGALGSIFGPLGSIGGSILGGLFGGVFSGTPRGSATIGGFGGDLTVTGTRGTSGSREEQSTELADSIIDTIDRIADQLGADVNAALGAVSIGIRDDNIRVDTSGSGITKTKNGAIDFGQDAEAAILFAVQDLINDGVIAGLSASEQRLLQQGKDLEQALTDVLTFRSVFDRLEQNLNPLRAEILALNTEFEDLIDLFERAGASSQEFAQLEELYDIERAKLIEEATDRVAGSLKDLIEDLTIGDNGLSLRDRRANALAEFEELRARVEGGDISAIDDFAEASRVLLDIERQLFGSQTGYFDRFNEVLAISNAVLAEQERLTQAAIDIGSPFSTEGTTDQTRPIVDSISNLGDRLVEQIGREISIRLDAVNQNLGDLSLNQINISSQADRFAIGQGYY